MRPSDLAAVHGLSAQAVRNYEAAGFLPPAARTASGYRVYTGDHAAALRAFLALVAAHGHATAGAIMAAVNSGDLDTALTAVDTGHALLRRDRATLAAVREAIGGLTAAPGAVPGPMSVGELARRLGVTAASLRNWETAGILAPARDRSGQRVYSPADVRDAELAHLLRRGARPLADIAAVVAQVREAGGTAKLSAALADWEARLTARGRGMLRAAGLLDAYLSLTGRP
ncbi:MerR family transcriptional regulator [Actinorhabdospora filicis]|uniref:MerR family transcriptional regulator n=1 Tax=Actinorhabdospora filicis TaxID=1785913 RepID=A0A9W6SH34_9ACTN|nr:MerR family DNA-binding transcriptional regulator [Actinorhabdospora filicis]GLZ75737.1 MerR family transcriptional regulator [Actinorhabdospora filicis]